jgi:hypothetical protein
MPLQRLDQSRPLRGRIFTPLGLRTSKILHIVSCEMSHMLGIPGYQVISEICKSAASIVYRAVNNSDNQPLVIKMLNEEHPLLENLTRYRHEYEILRSLDDVPATLDVTWDGLDAYGRKLYGTKPGSVELTCVYDAFYLPPPYLASTFGLASGNTTGLITARDPMSIRATQQFSLSAS